MVSSMREVSQRRRKGGGRLPGLWPASIALVVIPWSGVFTRARVVEETTAEVVVCAREELLWAMMGKCGAGFGAFRPE